MVMTPPNSRTGAVVVDANVVISLAANEPTELTASTEIARYSALGYEFFAPGVMVAETLYVLCGKMNDGTLSATDHTLAVRKLDIFLKNVSSAPSGDATLLMRSEAIRGDYSCRRSADGVYIALAEELSQTRPTVLLTFDQDMRNQATRNAPTVTVQVLTS